MVLRVGQDCHPLPPRIPFVPSCLCPWRRAIRLNVVKCIASVQLLPAGSIAAKMKKQAENEDVKMLVASFVATGVLVAVFLAAYPLWTVRIFDMATVFGTALFGVSKCNGYLFVHRNTVRVVLYRFRLYLFTMNMLRLE